MGSRLLKAVDALKGFIFWGGKSHGTTFPKGAATSGRSFSSQTKKRIRNFELPQMKVETRF